jgi:flagellar basal-body rod modification protein FlgD
MNVQGITPAISAPVQQASSLTTKASAMSSSSSDSSTSGSSLQTTFLNLLITELQNQDPTSPVDPTEMVGQMVALNQLDQLISINQTLQNLGSTSSGTSTNQSKSTETGTANSAQAAAKNAAAATATATAANALLSSSGTYSGSAGNTDLMNLYGSSGLPTANPYPTYTGAK